LTLLVGIRCSTGIVLAADGAATLGDVGRPYTARQPIEKLAKLGDHSILALCGFVGLSQEVTLAIRVMLGEWEDPRRERKTPPELEELEFRKRLRGAFATRHGLAVHQAAVAHGHPGLRVPLQSLPSCGGFLATVLDGSPRLFQIEEAGIEEIDKRLPGLSKGSGATSADPFLAMVRRVAWREQVPTIEQGLCAAFWTVRHVIDTSTGGVAEPIQIWSMTVQDGKAEIIEHSDTDLIAFSAAVEQAEGAIRAVFSSPLTEHSPPTPPEPMKAVT
jgi:20S proteasome alpha/beta subunit